MSVDVKKVDKKGDPYYGYYGILMEFTIDTLEDAYLAQELFTGILAKNEIPVEVGIKEFGQDKYLEFSHYKVKPSINRLMYLNEKLALETYTPGKKKK